LYGTLTLSITRVRGVGRERGRGEGGGARVGKLGKLEEEERKIVTDKV